MTRLQRVGFGLIIAYLAALAIRLAFTARLGHDDIEHLHCAWLMVQGQRPFLDFFQKQSPLFWWLLVPLVRLADGNLSIAVFLGRATMLASLAASLWAMTDLARRCCRHQRYAPAALFLALASPALLYNLLVIRPDGIMVALLLWGMVFISRYVASGSRTALVMAGSFLGLASAVLLKAVPVAVAIATVVMWLDSRKAGASFPKALKTQLLLLAGGLAVVVPFLVLLAGLGLLESFAFFNVTFNGELYRHPWPGDVGWLTRVTTVLGNEMRQEPWLLSLCVLANVFWPGLIADGHRQRDRITLLVLMALLVTGCIMLLVNRLPFYSYFLLPLLSGAVLAPSLMVRVAHLTSGHHLQWVVRHQSFSVRLFPVLMVALTLFIGALGSYRHNAFATNEGQLDKLAAISRHIGPYKMPDHPVFALDNTVMLDNVLRYQFTFRRLFKQGRIPAAIVARYRPEW